MLDRMMIVIIDKNNNSCKPCGLIQKRGGGLLQ